MSKTLPNKPSGDVAQVGSARTQASAEGPPPMAFDPSWIERHAIIDGRFRIERLLGKGGMGCVVLATHLELDQLVALKLILPGEEIDERSRTRLVREARAAVRIRSEHVARVFDVVSGAQAPPYIVMELLEGEDLAQRLERQPPLAIEESVRFVIQACEAIGEAHLLDIVHRDLKPSNLFLSEKPGRPISVKVLDFGISKSNSAEAHSLTQTGALLGSPAYSAPEQLRASRVVDQRADIWSLGVVLYQCLLGERPFSGNTLAQICTSILEDAPARPREQRSNIPEGLERAVLRCLEKEPAKRFDSIEALVLALREYAPDAARICLGHIAAIRPDRAGSSPDPLVRGSAAGAATLTGSIAGNVVPSPVPARQPRSGQRRTAVALGAALLLGVVVFAGWFVYHGYRPADAAVGTPVVTAVSAPAPAPAPSNPSNVAAPANAPAPPPVAEVPKAANTALTPRSSAEAVRHRSAPPPAPAARPGNTPRAVPAPRLKQSGASPTPEVPWVDSR